MNQHSIHNVNIIMDFSSFFSCLSMLRLTAISLIFYMYTRTHACTHTHACAHIPYSYVCELTSVLDVTCDFWSVMSDVCLQDSEEDDLEQLVDGESRVCLSVPSDVFHLLKYLINLPPRACLVFAPNSLLLLLVHNLKLVFWINMYIQGTQTRWKGFFTEVNCNIMMRQYLSVRGVQNSRN